MKKQILDELKRSFPDWKFQHSKDKDWLYEVLSPNDKSKLVFSYYDRLNIKFGKENLEFFHVPDSIDTLEKIKSEKLVYIEYILDRELAMQHSFEVPDGLPELQGCALIDSSEIPQSNDEYYFANKIRITSWLGTYNSEKIAKYGSQTA
ncbi:hypothetical protein HR060_18370 [Catenovulum sp. SM1970]|uniref:hypothetical protein n=1 Tax=Marinifaba aquimaris TaxID=2741323 RepID=UPI00157432B1|nr:hypothetical protein [Marinifaba aquimaris]NTS78810.1 hypothetical protein [Marinifaba aquimaris]